MTHFAIQATSDTVCPWCLVGLRRLQRAIKSHQQANPADTFSLRWAPYQLNPEAPTQSVERVDFYAQRFGRAAVGPMMARMAAVGAAEGIAFDNGGRVGNTRDSHRLLALAGAKGDAAKDDTLQTRVAEALFSAYFEQAGDITAPATLRPAAIGAGLAADDVDAVLGGAGDLYGAEVDAQAKRARFGGINGVPNYAVNGHESVIEGAEGPEAWAAVFAAIKRAESRG